MANRGAISSDPSDRSPSHLLNIHTYLVNFLVGPSLQRENGNGEYKHPYILSGSKGAMSKGAPSCRTISRAAVLGMVADPSLLSLTTLDDLSLECQRKPEWHVRLELGLRRPSNLMLMLKMRRNEILSPTMALLSDDGTHLHGCYLQRSYSEWMRLF